MEMVGMGLVCAVVVGGLVIAIGRHNRKLNDRVREQDTRHHSMEEGEMLAPPEQVLFLMHKCPDCGSDLLQGPCGGMSVNYACISLRCGSRFNSMGPLGTERISDPSPRRPRVEKVGHA